MRVAETIRALAPEMSGLFDKVELLCREISLKKRNKISPLGRPIPPNAIVWKCQLLEQFSIHRTCDLAEAIFDAWNKKRPAVAFILERAILETSAVLYYIGDKINSMIAKGAKNEVEKVLKEIDEIDLIATKFLVGNKFDKAAPHTPLNILTVIDTVDKKVPGIREAYEFSSEFAHPNNYALQGLYGDIDPDGNTKISSEIGFDKATIEIFFGGFASNLEVFLRAINGLEHLYQQLRSLDNEGPVKR